MWWFRARLIETMRDTPVEMEVPASEWKCSNGYPCRDGALVRVTDFDPDPNGEPDSERGHMEGTCTIRSAKGRRALFLDLIVEVPWRGYIDKGTERERSLGGKTRMWQITHFNEAEDWKHMEHG